MFRNWRYLFRYKIRNLLVLMTVVSLFFGWFGSEIRKAQTRTAIVERLAKIDVSIWRYEPTTIGSVTACFPEWIRSKLSPIFGDQLLKSPSTLLTASLIPSDIEILLHELVTLDSLESIVVMENQFASDELDRIRRNLSGVKVTEAVFITGIIFQR